MSCRKLVLIDGQNILYRTLVIQTYDGYNRQVAFENVCKNFLRQMVIGDDWESPYTQLMVVWDGLGTDPCRVKMHPEYKKTESRSSFTPEQREILFAAKDWLRRFLRYTCVDQAGFLKGQPGEADDVVAHVVKSMSRKDVRIELYSSDKDFYQLFDINENYRQTIPDARKPEVLTPEKVRARTKVSPGVYIAVKCFRGDASDNIPGIRGIGEKTTLQLVQAMGLDGWAASITWPKLRLAFVKCYKGGGCPSIALRSIEAAGGLKKVLSQMKHNYQMMKLPFPGGSIDIPGRAFVWPGHPRLLGEKIMDRRYSFAGEALEMGHRTERFRVPVRDLGLRIRRKKR